jgi:DNA repair protein RecO (recombination protein O)
MQAREAADIFGLEAAFRLTAHFFARHVYEPRGITPPESRAAFVAALKRRADAAA